MKIVYISQSIIPSRTANSIHVMKMCQAFADNGHEVILLAPDYKEQYEKDIDDIFEFYNVKNNFTVKKLFALNIKYKSLVYMLSILKYFFFNKADLVYGRFLFGCYISSLLDFKTILEVHAPIKKSSKFSMSIFNKLIENNKFSKLVVISQVLKDIYISNGYLNNEMIEVAHDGADKVENLNRKIKLKGKDEVLKVGYIGHLYKGKGMEVIEKIADKVSDDVEFHIIGGLEKDIQYWKNKIKSTNVYFYGFVQQKDLTMYTNSIDICLLPNQKVILPNGAKNDSDNISAFTSPLKMFEYMAHKKAIISSDNRVLQEVLDSSMSILVDPEDYSQWLKAIEQMKDKKLRESLSTKAFEEFKKYTWENRAYRVLLNY